MMTMEKINIQNKFSFDPSQEDEGQKKTFPGIERCRLTKYHVCPIHAEPIQLFSR